MSWMPHIIFFKRKHMQYQKFANSHMHNILQIVHKKHTLFTITILHCSVCKNFFLLHHFFFCPKDGLELCWLVPETCKRCFQMFSEKSYIYMRKLKWGHVVRIQRCGCGVCKDFGWCYDIPNRKRGSHLNRYQIGKKNWNSFGHKLWT